MSVDNILLNKNKLKNKIRDGIFKLKKLDELDKDQIDGLLFFKGKSILAIHFGWLNIDREYEDTFNEKFDRIKFNIKILNRELWYSEQLGELLNQYIAIMHGFLERKLSVENQFKLNFVMRVWEYKDIKLMNMDQIDLLIFINGKRSVSNALLQNINSLYIQKFEKKFSMEKTKNWVLECNADILVYFKDDISEIAWEKYGAKIIMNSKYSRPKILKHKYSEDINKCIDEKGYVTTTDTKMIASKYNVAIEDVKCMLRKYKYLFKTDHKVAKDIRDNKHKQEIEKLEQNGFVKIYKKYWISKDGLIYKESKQTLTLVKHLPRVNNKNTSWFGVSVAGQNRFLHRLLAEVFIPNPNDYKIVMAKDGNYRNISLDNLVWTHKKTDSRIRKSIINKKDVWLNFIVKNIIEGVSMTDLSKILADEAKRQGKFIDNHNKESTVWATIYKYSTKKHNIFPIFVIREDLQKTVFLNHEFLSGVK